MSTDLLDGPAAVGTNELPFHLLQRLEPDSLRHSRDKLAAQLEELPAIAEATGHTATLNVVRARSSQQQLEDYLLALGVPVFTADSVQKYQMTVAARGQEQQAALQAEVNSAEQLLLQIIPKPVEDEESRDAPSFQPVMSTYNKPTVFIGYLGILAVVWVAVATLFDLSAAVLAVLSTAVGLGFILAGFARSTVLSVEKQLAATRQAKLDGLLARAAQIMTYRWDAVPLASYEEEVPVTVLRRGKLIREQCPDAELLVERLLVAPASLELSAHIWTTARPDWRTACDPFLLVKRGSAMAYVGVWEEPGYEVEIAN